MDTSTDKLSHIFQLQNSFDSALCEKRDLGHITRQEWMQKEILAMLSELAELLDEVQFKWWKNPTPMNEEAAKEELVDILHFFVSMCLKMDMDADELYRRYLEKNKENFDRQKGRTDRDGYTWE